MSSDVALLQTAPGRLAGERPLYGRFAGPVADVSTAQWDGGKGPFSPRRLKRKAWVYFGAYTERFTIGFATVDAGYIGTGFVYVFDNQLGRLVEETVTAPFAFEKNFAPSLFSDWTLSRGRRRWSVVYDDGWRASFAGQQVALELRLEKSEKGMTTIVPSPERPFAHTYKDAAIPLSVSVKAAGESWEEKGFGLIDFTLGYPPRHTMWNWAAAAGKAGAHTVGLNLVANFNNGVENALWLDGRLIPLSQALFDYDDENAPWSVRTLDGAVDLQFEPAGCRRENLRVGVLESRFIQPFGTFSGIVRHGGETVQVRLPGVVEEHFAVW